MLMALRFKPSRFFLKSKTNNTNKVNYCFFYKIKSKFIHAESYQLSPVSRPNDHSITGLQKRKFESHKENRYIYISFELFIVGNYDKMVNKNCNNLTLYLFSVALTSSIWSSQACLASLCSLTAISVFFLKLSTSASRSCMILVLSSASCCFSVN